MTMDLPVCLIYVIFYITMKSQYEAKLVRGNTLVVTLEKLCIWPCCVSEMEDLHIV